MISTSIQPFATLAASKKAVVVKGWIPDGQASGGICHIGRLIVHPRLQRRGLGKKLMLAIEEQFTDVVRYELFTGHLSVGNLHLYHNLGYTTSHEKTVSSRLRLVYLEKQRPAL